MTYFIDFQWKVEFSMKETKRSCINVNKRGMTNLKRPKLVFCTLRTVVKWLTIKILVGTTSIYKSVPVVFNGGSRDNGIDSGSLKS